MLNRRQLLGRVPALAGLPLLSGLFGLPSQALAGPATKRKFLFVFAGGGWDPTWVFAPMLDSPYVDSDPSATVSELGGLRFVDAASRPSVRSFFERYASSSCILNGLEVRSVTHDRCRRILMTGQVADGLDDWPAILAGSSTGYQLPHLVVSGPSYSNDYTTSVMRVGENGQLSRLSSGSAVRDLGLPLPTEQSAAQIEDFVRARSAQAAAGPGTGRNARFHQDLETSIAQASLLSTLSSLEMQVDNSGVIPFSVRSELALHVLAENYSRCVTIEHDGNSIFGWDLHSNIDQMSRSYDALFSDLAALMSAMERLPGASTPTLAEEVVIVLCSEMGRTPRRNSSNGKDHWTFTSAMLVGPGVAGGQVIGGFDEGLYGLPTDPLTGVQSEKGSFLTAAHLGATLLRLAELDPAQWTGAEPVLAAIQGA